MDFLFIHHKNTAGKINNQFQKERTTKRRAANAVIIILGWVFLIGLDCFTTFFATFFIDIITKRCLYTI